MGKHSAFVPGVTVETVAQMIRQQYPVTKIRLEKESFWISMSSLPRRTRMGLQFLITGKITQQPDGCRISYRVFPGILCCVMLSGFCAYFAISLLYFILGWGSWVSAVFGAVVFLLVSVLIAWQGSLCAKKFRAALTEGNRPLP